MTKLWFSLRTYSALTSVDIAAPGGHEEWRNSTLDHLLHTPVNVFEILLVWLRGTALSTGQTAHSLVLDKWYLSVSVRVEYLAADIFGDDPGISQARTDTYSSGVALPLQVSDMRCARALKLTLIRESPQSGLR